MRSGTNLSLFLRIIPTYFLTELIQAIASTLMQRFQNKLAHLFSLMSKSAI